jgi:hypothetical protein
VSTRQVNSLVRHSAHAYACLAVLDNVHMRARMTARWGQGERGLQGEECEVITALLEAVAIVPDALRPRNAWWNPNQLRRELSNYDTTWGPKSQYGLRRNHTFAPISVLEIYDTAFDHAAASFERDPACMNENAPAVGTAPEPGA